MAAETTESRTATPTLDWLTVALVLGGVLCLYYLAPLVSLFLSVPIG